MRNFTPGETILRFRDNGQLVEVDVVDLMRFDPEDMLHELVEHSANYCYFASVEVRFNSELAELKRDADELRGQLILGLADEKEARGRNFTVAMQTAVVEQNAGLIEATDKVEKLSAIVREIGAVVKAFEHRKEMLARAANWIGKSESGPYVKPDPKAAVAEASKRRKVT